MCICSLAARTSEGSRERERTEDDDRVLAGTRKTPQIRPRRIQFSFYFAVSGESGQLRIKPVRGTTGALFLEFQNRKNNEKLPQMLGLRRSSAVDRIPPLLGLLTNQQACGYSPPNDVPAT